MWQEKQSVLKTTQQACKFQFDLNDALGYTLMHFHQHAEEHTEHQLSSIGKHYKNKHLIVPKELDKQFFVLKKTDYKKK